MVMLSYADAMALLRKCNLHPDIVSHCVGVAHVALDLAQRIQISRPQLPLDANLVHVSALLHDIGRARPGIHEWNGVRMMRTMGHDDLAAILMHGTLYETMLNRGKEDPRLLPQTLEQKIMNYADLRFCQNPMTLDERLADALERKKDSPQALADIELARPRLKALEKEILSLTKPEPTPAPLP